MTTAAALADLHPSIGRRIRRRRGIAYGCHAFVGGVMLLAMVANLIDADGRVFWVLDLILSCPATLFVVVVAAVAGPVYTFSARWEAGLVVLSVGTATVIGLLTMGTAIPGWFGTGLIVAWTIGSLALPARWFARGRRRFSESAGID